MTVEETLTSRKLRCIGIGAWQANALHVRSTDLKRLPILIFATVALILADFEKDSDKSFEAPGVTIVAEHARSGQHALKVTSFKDGYPGLRFENAATLRHFGDFPLFRVDIFNPQDAPVVFSASAGDAK